VRVSTRKPGRRRRRPRGCARPAERDAEDRIVAGADHADSGRTSEQRGEQVAARLQRVIERQALVREQQRAIQVLVREGARAEPLGVGGDRVLVRGAALVERDEPAITASTSSAATPASPARRRRCSRSLAARLAARNARSVVLRSAARVDAQSSTAASLAPL
jgi:hypothetical protein